ncbi:MAG: AbrB family transcriptional regulator, partial [Microcoleus sp. SIO2G3]|nr:AbrB family transcriptional regulator [Microcoleus sp. SIO2G3]
TSIPVALTFLAGFTAAGITMYFTHWDWLTCLLMAAPGGSPEMILIALVLNHNVETITAAHLVRLMAINVYLPVLIWALEKYGRESKETKTIMT